MREELVRWVTATASIPVIAKLTPNVTDIIEPGLAAKRGGADAVSLINTCLLYTSDAADE